MKNYFVYIMTNTWNDVLYTSITNNLSRRVWEHKNKLVKGFTSKYNTNKLVYYEVLYGPREAIEREKQIKKLHRANKLKLIKQINSEFKDLYNEVL